MKKYFLCFIIFLFVSISVNNISCFADKLPDQEDNTDRKNISSLTWEFTYDNEDRINSITDPGNKKTKYHYSPDKIKRIHADNTKVTFDFDKFGRMKKMTDTHGVVHYSYDNYNHLTCVKRHDFPEISYQYDTMDRIKSISIGKDLTIKYIYDFSGNRLSEIKVSNGESISYHYNSRHGRVTRKFSNGLQSVCDTLPNGNIETISYIMREKEIFTRFNYSYRPDNLLGLVEEWQPRHQDKISYKYDKVHRLNHISRSSGHKTSYSWDKSGNRLTIINGYDSSQCSYNWAGQLASLDGRSCIYDASGNLISYNATSNKSSYKFNAINLLKTAIINGIKIEYEYDGGGYLLSRTVDNKKTSFVHDPLANFWKPLLAIDPVGEKTFYIWHGHILLMSITENNTKFYFHDRLGSVRCVADDRGNILQNYNYTGFGVPTQNFESSALQPGYAGLFFDPMLKMYLTYGRTYNPQTGRFLQIDPQHRIPEGSQKDLSVYTYCGGDPANFIDRTGCAPEPIDESVWIPASAGSRNVSHPDTLYNQLSDPDFYIDLALDAIKGKAIQCFRDQSDLIDLGAFSYDELKYYSGTTKDFFKANHFNEYYNVGLRFVNQFGRYTLPGFTANALLTAKDKIYQPMLGDIKSSFNQKYSENLVTLPLGVSNQIGPSIKGTAHKNYGNFSMEGKNNNFKAHGSWGRLDYPSKSAVSFRARWQFDNVFLRNGARMSGNFYREKTQIQSGNNYNNKTVSRSNYNVSYNGAAISKAVEEYNRTGVYDPAKWHGIEKTPKQSKSLASPRMLIDIPGVDWKGGVRDYDWGEMLDNKKKTIYIRHKGPGKDDWEPPKEPDAQIITLPEKFDVSDADKILQPIIKSAFSQNQDVHFVIDKNITFIRHVSPSPKKSEDIWAAEVVDYISNYKPKDYKGILAEHSRGTTTNKYIKDFSGYECVLISSPRGDDALSWISETTSLPQVYIITGLSDAPAWRWTERLGKLVKRPNVTIVQLKNISDPVTTHSNLQKINTKGNWKLITQSGEKNVSTNLGNILASGFSANRFHKESPSRRRREGPLSSLLFGGGNDGGGGPGGPGGGPGGSSFLSHPPSMSPTNVGGIRLKGAGKALKHLGNLKGVAVDKKSGKLILLSEDEKNFDLPPLRLDDIVTVFRSVYFSGSPSVTIDPVPNDPIGPEMLVFHDKMTENSYVGWILFEADRWMKSYSLGQDNVSKKRIISKIKNYLNYLKFDCSDNNNKNGEPNWERFWIVPSEVHRNHSQDLTLSLLDVKLKVKTEKMEWLNGKLKSVQGAKSSDRAEAFSEWFTNNYDKISEEALSIPPEGGPVTSPVKVFSELKRMVFITAIAEALRDSGVPLPAWMLNYQVKPCKVDPTTPSINVRRRINGTDGRSCVIYEYGGVKSAPSDKDVHTTKNEKDAENMKLAASPVIANAPLFSPISFKENKKEYKAIALPGNDTPDFNANQLEEVDLVVPVHQGTYISLSRKFHSFFEPTGVLGKGWTLDMPRLIEQKFPVKRVDDKTEYKIVYQLSSPFNTYSEYFKDHKYVPETNGKLLVPERSENLLGIADTKIDKIGFSTKTLIFRNGMNWHFNNKGYLAAQIQGPLMVIYRRNKDKGNRVQRIEGWYGKVLLADIKIEYNEFNRIKKAIGSNKESAEFHYDSYGALSSVRKRNGTIKYKNNNGRVIAVSWNGKQINRYEYGDNGQLLSETFADDLKKTYKVKRFSDSIRIESFSNNGLQMAEYDSSNRPLKKIFEDGTQIIWNYLKGDIVNAKIILPNGEQYKISAPSGRKKVTWQTPRGANYSAEFDKAGQLSALYRDKQEVLKLNLNPDGLPGPLTQETGTINPEYGTDNVLNGLFITPPVKKTSYRNWVRIKLDGHGRPNVISDYSGSEIKIGYEENGDIYAFMFKYKDNNNMGMKLNRDEKGRIQKIESSIGPDQEYTYGLNNNELKNIKYTLGKNERNVHFENGRPTNIEQFDGGIFNIAYHDHPVYGGRKKQIKMPNSAVLNYEYNPEGRLERVGCNGLYDLDYAYDDQGRLISLGYRDSKSQRPVHKKRTSSSMPQYPSLLDQRLKDSIQATKELNQATVLDVFNDNGKPHMNIVLPNGEVREIESSAARKYKELLDETVKKTGKIGKTTLKEWEIFYEQYLYNIKPKTISLPGDINIKLKPTLIIKSNDVNYQYSNLEKIPALRDNFIIFIASKPVEEKSVSETKALDLARKMKQTPNLSTQNVVFAIRPPKEGLTSEQKQKWIKHIDELKNLVGSENVLFNPDKNRFKNMLQKRNKEIIVIEITHTAKEGGYVKLKDGEQFATRDVLKMEDLSHIKYLMGGNSCELPLIDNGKFSAALREKGVGIMNVSYRKVNMGTVLKRLEILIKILENEDKFSFPAYYLPDVIDQSSQIKEKEKGTTNLGKLQLIKKEYKS